MSVFEAIILGLVQGLTEFLPVSSSGHLEIGHVLFGVDEGNNLMFDILVHGATVLSTLFVFRKEIVELLSGLFKFQWNEETQYIFKLILSAIPVAFAGLFFEEQIEALFSGNLVFIGSMLLVTAALLSFAYFSKPRTRKINFLDALLIGGAQVLAIIPGVSRSGATIATGMLIGNNKANLAKFSFLMVIIPILGANFLKIVSGGMTFSAEVGVWPLIAGFFAAFVSGLLACRWMVNIVRKGKLIYFALYCVLVGLIAIFAA
ncbi:MAG: undecaprenyl-diphosphate phosphatase [Prolixibacteraceae bacterium]|nr:undecaprenyl-diphosphate phosphatase [Prolixibacteraceae bacterium]MBN2650713.1 undecaprenyl-diphosphate phosphatase [Prolixibacteraceae bacterium]